MTPAALSQLQRDRTCKRPIIVQGVRSQAGRVVIPRGASPLEEKFLRLWTGMGGPQLEREYHFAPPRRYRFDFAHVASMTAIELEGGVYSGGRHVRPKGFEQDARKYNLASLAGWVVVRITARMLDDETVRTVLDRVRRTTPEMNKIGDSNA
jgi:very-short-patch-repair endonuclease